MFSSKKPYSSVTVAIEGLTGEQYEVDEFSGIPDLVESIKLQSTGSTEAARAIRKKLKYGNVHRQLRALTILDGLIQNAGAQFQRTVADEMLLERLRVCGTSDLSDPLVKAKCKELFRSWAIDYKNVRGLEKIAALNKELPHRKQVVTQAKSKVLRETEQNPFEGDEEEDRPKPSTSPPSDYYGATSASSTNRSREKRDQLKEEKHKEKERNKEKERTKKSGKKKAQTFNLEAEKETMKTCIAETSVASTNLLNALRLINREHERISDNENAVAHFDNCKLLRRKILRYIQHVESEQWLGALLHANDELVTALMTFEQLDSSIDADSDSDDELAEQAHMYKVLAEKRKETETANQLAGLNINATKTHSPAPAPPQPPRRVQMPPPPAEEDEVEEDENDPFADSNAVATPQVEKGEPRWKVV